MQRFINNWSAVLAAPVTASAVSLSVPLADAAKLTGLGSGDYYLLTLAEVNQAGQEVAWEVVKVTAAADGVLTVERGIEGAAREWLAGAAVSARVTAGTLASLRDAAQAGGGLPAIIGTGYPDSAPPAIGAHYIYDEAVFIAVGTAEPEHWVQIAGPPSSDGDSVEVGRSPTIVVGRMIRSLVLNAYGTTGAALPVALFMLPEWQASPGKIELRVAPQVAGLTANIDLDFGESWSFAEFFVAPSPVYSVTRAGNKLSLVVTEGALVTFKVEVYEDSLYVLMQAAAYPIPELL